MVQEGLKLLLQDLQCGVTFVCKDDLQQFLIVGADCPQLIIASIALEGNASGERLIRQLRAHYKTDIPVILLDNEHSFEVIYNKNSNTYFSDCLKPKLLRKNIIELLDRAIMPFQQ